MNRKKNYKMDNYRKFFVKEIEHSYPGNQMMLISQTDENFTIISKDITFAKRSANPIDHRLNFSAYFLALVKTLDEHGEGFETIRQVCLKIVSEYVRPKNKVQLFFKKLPAKLINTWLSVGF